MKKKIVKISQLDIPKDFSLEETGVTQSLLAVFLQCRRKFLFKINRYYIPSNSKALHFGTMIHAMLAQWYETGKYNIDNWKDTDFRLDTEEIELQKAKAECLLPVYTRIYKKEKLQEIEEVFEYEFLGFKLLVKVDGLKIDKTVKPIDHKTAGRIDDETLLDKLQLDFQLLFYASVMNNYESIKCNGAYYNVIRNPGHKLNKGETYKKYKERLLKEIEKNPEHFFKRFEISLTQRDIEVYRAELLLKLKEMEMVVNKELPIYRNESACIQGQFKCEYLATCLSGNMSLCKRSQYVHKELYK